jgi:ubiquinone/menaquinone biosynthesis C-methylase UbiE
MSENEIRKKREAEFHDILRGKDLEKDREKYKFLTSNRKFYSITRKTQNLIMKLAMEWGKRGKVLDYCCGDGQFALKLAEKGIEVIGIDISPESIKIAKNEAVERGVSEKASFLVMDGEDMEFEDNSFDLILCLGVLHHLDIGRAYQELARVLKPDGKIICDEPLIHNPVFQLYRRLTPHLRTEWETEHILSRKDIQLAEKYFGRVEKRFFYLFTLLAVPFRNTFLFKPILWFLEIVDSIILSLPGVKWLAWQIVFILSSPRKEKKIRV